MKTLLRILTTVRRLSDEDTAVRATMLIAIIALGIVAILLAWAMN